MLLRRTVAATTRPVSLSEARDHLRVTGTDEDPLIEGLLGSACDLIGEMAGRVLAQETWAASYAALSGDVVLPKNPVIAVTGIGYYDLNDAAQVAVLSDFYVFSDPDSTVVRPKSNKQWPNTSTRDDAITITFTVGYAPIPEALRAAILLTIGHLYENRQSVVTGMTATVMPMSIEHLVGVHRLGWVSG